MGRVPWRVGDLELPAEERLASVYHPQVGLRDRHHVAPQPVHVVPVQLARELLAVTESATDRFPPDPAAADAEATERPSSSALPEGDVRAAPAPVEAPVEDALPDDAPAGAQDPDVEPTAIMPIVEPTEDDSGQESH